MSKITLVKKENLEEAQVFLDGGLIGADASRGLEGLVGKTLVFTAPGAFTVTFAIGAGENPYKLGFKEIKAQIEAVVPAVHVRSIGGRIVLVEDAPTSGIALSATGTANADLGFSNVASAGRVINAPGGAAPKLSLLTVTADNRLILAISEA